MEKFSLFKTNKIFSFVIAKYVLALVMLFITQLVFYLFNSTLFEPTTFGGCMKILWGNIVFGISTTAMILTPYFILNVIPISLRWNPIYKKVCNVIYCLSVIVMIMANLIDGAYYQFTFRRMTSEIFGFLGVGGDFGNLIPQFLHDYWPFVIIFIVMLFVFFWCNNRIVLTKRTSHPYGKQIVTDSILSVLFIAVVVLAIRGGFGYKPIRPIDASKYATCNNTSLVINTPFSIIKTFNKTSGVENVEYFSSEEALNAVFNPINTPLAEIHAADTNYVPTTTDSLHAKKNVCIIILESFSEEYIGFLNPEIQSFTPFLDSLSHHCTIYQGMSNGKRSIEAIPSILSSMPSLMYEPFITSPYAMNKIEGLPEVLKRNGYYTSFFHGAYNGSMNFDAFVKSIGVDHYYGKNEYVAECGDINFDGNWGIFDEPFLQFMAKKVSTFKQPFFTSVFTISSHHPYTVPEEHIGEFNKGKHPILEVVMYADYALKRFFETASKTDWYKNTLFVITADHASVPISATYANGYDVYKIPMMIFDPAHDTHIVANRIMQQTDIFPTIVDYLNLDEKTLTFGKSVLNPQNPEFYVSYGSSAYQFIKDKYYIRYDGEKLEVFDRYSDPNLTTNLAETERQAIRPHLNYLKAIIQQYNSRMIANKLRVERKK